MPRSPDNTIIKTPGAVITDASGNQWQIVNGQVVINGIPDPTTTNGLILAYENGEVWQMNSNRLWWSKSGPADPWSPPYGTSVSPLTGVASPNNTVFVGSVVSSILPHSITDANDDSWSITANGRVAVNGVTDPTTGQVIAIAYENGIIWQENADHLWWSRTNAASQWSPRYGTPFSPVPATATEPPVLYFDGDIVNYTNTETPVMYSVIATDDGEKGITFNYTQENTNAGSIRNAMGQLTLNVTGVLISTGTLTTQGGIGSAFTTINLAYASTFTNAGLMSTKYATAGGALGTMEITGSGTFQNLGTMDIDGGSSTDFSMSGDFDNAGSLIINDSFGTQHAIITSGNIINTGTIENHNQTTIQWGYTGPPQNLSSSVFINDGLIENLYDVGHLTLAAGAFVHAADSYQVHDYHGTLLNNGQIVADGGGDEIEIAAPLEQGPTGQVDIEDGATVKLDSTTDGGVINLTAGMLDFGGDRIEFYGPTGATGLHSPVDLSGTSAAFNFERADISETFLSSSPNSADLLINLTAAGAGQQIADIHLIGAYHASQFKLSGSELIYTKTA